MKLKIDKSECDLRNKIDKEEYKKKIVIEDRKSKITISWVNGPPYFSIKKMRTK